jgi:3-phytase
VIFKIDKKQGTLTDITGGDTSVFKGETGPASEPMGIALYRRPSDGSVHAFVSRKTGPKSGYLGQYRLASAANGKVNLEMVRVLGNWSGVGEIESIAVDDKAGLVVYSDEGFGYRVWKADPDAPGADKEVNVIGKAGWKGDREGVGFYPLGGKTLSVCTDQIIGGSKYYIFENAEKSADAPIAVMESTADETDGIEVTARPLGPKFPNGMLVVMNSSGRNFWLFNFPSGSL